MVTCFGNFSPLAEECRQCRVKARCATRTNYGGFGLVLHPRYRGVDLSYRVNPETTDTRAEKVLARVAGLGFTVRGCNVFLGTGRTFAKVGLRYGYIAVYFHNLPPGRVMSDTAADNTEVMTWRKRCDTGLVEKGCIALCIKPLVASMLIRSVAVSLSNE